MENNVEELVQLREKVKVYEKVFHDIQMFTSITGDMSAMRHAIAIINEWSFAHRSGNGELTEEEQAAHIQKQFERLKAGEYRDSRWNSTVVTEYNKRIPPPVGSRR
jgi:hypothetical protein